MSVAAAVQFTQGATIGIAGQALFGATAVAVTVANGNNANVTNWTFTVVDVPPGSAVPVGVVQGPGVLSTWAFTPDVSGGYLVTVTVTDGTNSASDTRTFGVRRASGKFIPPFTATAAHLNFSGQTRGWAKLMDDPTLGGWLKFLDADGVPAGQMMFATSNGSAWEAPSGDVSSSGATPGLMTVTGLWGNALPAPSGTGTTIIWNGTALSWGAGGGGTVAWSNDLSGNGTTTNSNQYVSSLSYSSSAGGGPIAVHGTGTSILVDANNAGFSLSQQAAAAGAGVMMSFTAQAAHVGSGATGGMLLLSGGAGDGVGLPGPAVLASGGVKYFAAWSRTLTSSFSFDSGNPDGTVFVDTTGGVVVGTLPAPRRCRLRVVDAKQNWQVDKFTLAPHGGEKINGLAGSKDITTEAGFVDIEGDGTDWYTS